MNQLTKLWLKRGILVVRRARLLRQHKSTEAVDQDLQRVTTKIIKIENKRKVA